MLAGTLHLRADDAAHGRTPDFEEEYALIHQRGGRHFSEFVPDYYGSDFPTCRWFD